MTNAPPLFRSAMKISALPALLFVWVFMALAVAMIPTGGATAQVQQVNGELVTENARVKTGKSTRIALYMTPQEGWHGYWKNGGDAGFGMQLDWDLPAGVSISEGRYPVPQTYMLQGLMNHVYERPYAILFDLQVDESLSPGTVLPIRANGRWLACSDKICLPQQGRFETALTVVDSESRISTDARFSLWTAQLPSRLSREALYQRDGSTLRLSIPFPEEAQLTDPHFFAETQDMIDYASPQRFARSGDRLLIEMEADTRLKGREALAGVLKIGTDRGLDLIARPGSVPALPANDTGFSAVEGAGGLALIFLAALLGGLILNVMPCVFPILGLKAISLAKAGGDENAARREALGYTLGAVLMATALGALLLMLRSGGEQVGWAFQLQNPATVLFLLLLMVAITANLLGAFELPGGNFAQATDMRSSVVTGALAAFVATPCTGPFMAAALGASLLLPWPAALLLFAALGLGLALPFLAIGFVPRLRRMMPRPGPWLQTFRRWMALPMALTALALLWLWTRISSHDWLVLLPAAGMLALLIAAGFRQKRGNGGGVALAAAALLIIGTPAVIAAFPGEAGSAERDVVTGDIAFSVERLEQLRREDRPVFLYFTADWCITCKANEAAALNVESVRDAFERADVVVMRGDFTRTDDAIARFLSDHGRVGVPLYLYYPAGGTAPVELPQILTPNRLIALTTNGG